MATAKIALGSRTQVTGAATALNSLANGTYVSVGSALTLASAGKVPLDWMVEVAITPGTVSGNKQAVLFAQSSGDGTVFSTGPSSGATITDEGNLIYIGTLPLNSNGTLQRKWFSLANQMPGGILPFAVKLIVKNDSGAAFAASGNDVYTQDSSGDIT